MPVSLKEAMALELPVVATDEVGLPELVGPDRGRLVAPGDAEALAAALVELYELPADERVRMGRAGARVRAGALQPAHRDRQAARADGGLR